MGTKNSRFQLTEQKIHKRIEEGRGQGECEQYKPWHQMEDTPSSGLSTRYFGMTVPRLHHLFSLLELRTICFLDFSDWVVDIREQFPLDQKETIEIAEELDIKHPKSNATKTYWVMTTDFLITVQAEDGLYYLAVTVKPSSILNKQRVLEKLQIERSYWARRGIDYLIVTEQELSKVIADNILLIHKRAREIHERNLSQELIDQIISMVKPDILRMEEPLRDLTNRCDEWLSLEEGTSLSAVYYMIAMKLWRVDMRQPIDPTKILVLSEDKSPHGFE